jgi:hypothetical protein
VANRCILFRYAPSCIWVFNFEQQWRIVRRDDLRQHLYSLAQFVLGEGWPQ